MHSDLPQGHIAILESMPRGDEMLHGDVDLPIVAVGEETRSVLNLWKWTPQRYSDEGVKWPARSSLAVAVHEGSELRALFGALWMEPRRFSSIGARGRARNRRHRQIGVEK